MYAHFIRRHERNICDSRCRMHTDLVVPKSLLCLCLCLTPVCAQWVPTNGPPGFSGNIQSLAADGSTVIAGTNGPFLSTDNGGTWKRLNTGLPTGIVVYA